ncbi:MAG: abortive infection family protein [Allosphingosinicella sp.]|uniref:abortive infection family protein n=1 Tax=Allosphingosinicella sp. TaxID=2823234 RepID=UPI00395AFFDA
MAAPAPQPFVMHGARDAMAAGLAHIEEQVKGIEQAVVENPGLAFDLAKTLVESTCRAVLGERAVAFDSTDDLPKLFKSATQNLPFLPATASDAAEVRKSLVQTLSGLSTAVQGICELRNQCGFASHGSGEPRPVMEAVQALLAAEAADAIVGFLHRVHRQDRTLPPAVGPSFDDNGAFNEHVDETFGPVRVFEVEFRASEVLFRMEPETYRIYLAEFDGNNADTVAPADEEAQV